MICKGGCESRQDEAKLILGDAERGDAVMVLCMAKSARSRKCETLRLMQVARMKNTSMEEEEGCGI